MVLSRCWSELEAYRLELLPTSLLHPVFHVSMLKKQVEDSSLVLKELPDFDEGDIIMS